MRYEIEQNELLEQASELEKSGTLEKYPPKMERSQLIADETAETEQPPKLGRSDMDLDAGDQNDMEEYYRAKKEKLQAEMDERKEQQTVRRFQVNYGTPTTESGWKQEAANEYAKWGKETPYYNNCMKQAAKSHVEGK